MVENENVEVTEQTAQETSNQNVHSNNEPSQQSVPDTDTNVPGMNAAVDGGDNDSWESDSSIEDDGTIARPVFSKSQVLTPDEAEIVIQKYFEEGGKHYNDAKKHGIVNPMARNAYIFNTAGTGVNWRKNVLKDTYTWRQGQQRPCGETVVRL